MMQSFSIQIFQKEKLKDEHKKESQAIISGYVFVVFRTCVFIIECVIVMLC